MAILKKLRTKRGFTLIELMIVVVIIGILASVAIYGVFRYIANAKSSEAKNMVGRMAKDAVASFESEQQAGAGSIIAAGTTAEISRRMCASSTMVPSAVPQRAKYQSLVTEWQTGNEDQGWACLATSMNGPQYFSYQYVSSVSAGTSAAANQTFSALAHGDLDADGNISTFAIKGQVLEEGNEFNLTYSPAILEQDPGE